MEMIIGGAFQGKSSYVKNKYPEIQWKSGKEIDEETLMETQGVFGFHEYIRKELKAGRTVAGLAEKLIERNPGLILVCDEVGYGVVPVDAFDREYRETVGRVCTKLASASKRVVRVVCGIGTVIKDA